MEGLLSTGPTPSSFQSINPLGRCFLIVNLSVCSLLRYRINIFLPQLPEVGYPIFLEIWNPWEKIMEGSRLGFEIFVFKLYKIIEKNGLFCLAKYGGNHVFQSIRDLWSKGVSLILAYFRCF